MHNKIDEIKELIQKLNYYCDKYYNEQPVISDKEYDILFDHLADLEKETGIYFSNSPTQRPGYEVKSKLEKIKHKHPMLSLDKCHTAEEVMQFGQGQELLAMLKLDGLTVSAEYDNGKLVRLETRGNGIEGNDILFHASSFINLPLTIKKEGIYVIDGEAVITYKDFEKINETLPDDEKYKNPRNLAAGSLNLLDSNISASRWLRFVAWDVIEGDEAPMLSQRLRKASALGFDVVPSYMDKWTITNLPGYFDYIKEQADSLGLPIDGIVFKYNDIAYGKAQGFTGHHFKNGIAYKFKDDVYETELLDIEWTMGKTGQLTPTAIFKEVEIDGTMVSRASVHNVSILMDLALMRGDIIEVYKANMIIPQVKRNISAEHRDMYGGVTTMSFPTKCPVCGGETRIKRDNVTEVLTCTNPNCKGKLLGKLSHFVSKNAMNIEGLSEATLEKFIEHGFVESYVDIYELKARFYNDIIKLEGFGKKSVDKLMQAIETSKHITLDRFIYSLSIPLIGRSASKDIAKACANGDWNQFNMIMSLEGEHAFRGLNGFGKEMSKSLNSWWCSNKEMFYELSEYLTFDKPKTTSNLNNLNGKTFCITGKLEKFANRDEVKEKIESLGGKVTGSVTGKTSYLISNEASNSGKSKKARELGIPVITEEEFLNKFN